MNNYIMTSYRQIFEGLRDAHYNVTSTFHVKKARSLRLKIKLVFRIQCTYQ